MSEGINRDFKPNDTASKEAIERTEYWLCECGVARVGATEMLIHLDEDGHIAERINTEKSCVTGFIAAGMESDKYASVPGSARLPRDKLKNEPMFERP